jgi:hypothetical protein
MQNLFVLLVCLMCSATGWGQEKVVDTVYVKQIITGIDTFHRGQSGIHHYIVRRYSHNETTVNFEYLLDTVSWNLYKAAYVAQTIISIGDTANRLVSFYLNQNRYVVAKVEVIKNSQVTDSTLFYLEMAGDSLVFLNTVKSAGTVSETKENLQSKAKELWLWATALKESLQRPKTANTGLSKKRPSAKFNNKTKVNGRRSAKQ